MVHAAIDLFVLVGVVLSTIAMQRWMRTMGRWQVSVMDTLEAQQKALKAHSDQLDTIVHLQGRRDEVQAKVIEALKQKPRN